MSLNLQEAVDLVTFTEAILNGKHHLLSSDLANMKVLIFHTSYNGKSLGNFFELGSHRGD